MVWARPPGVHGPRARPRLGISVPVAWEELSSLKGGDHWTVRTAHARLDEGNRAWDAYNKSVDRLTAAMRKLPGTRTCVID